MNMLKWCEANGVSITGDQLLAARFLDSVGCKFCVEYGYENVETVARQKFRELYVPCWRLM